MDLLFWTTVFLSGSTEIHGLGCMPPICKGHETNHILGCYGSACGTYGTLRLDGRLAEAVDLSCDEGSVVVAPFDGKLRFWRPYEGASNCVNEGVKITGVGQWQGYRAYIAPVLLDFFSGPVQKGQRIGIAKNFGCIFNATTPHHIRLNLLKSKKFIDPTYHLTDCMCTGQICETNINNDLLGKPFHYENAYNGVFGWSIKCPMPSEEDAKEIKLPHIFSPIDAKFIGRLRWYTEHDEYHGCDNNGLVLIGTDSWEDFEVRIYNVVYEEGTIGHQRIVQGQVIGTRLNCTESPDTVFMEVRYRGRVVDISDLITAKLCKKPFFVNQNS